MKAFTVGSFCRSLSVPSPAGGITQNVGRHELVRRPALASAKTNRVSSTGTAVGVAGWPEQPFLACPHFGPRTGSYWGRTGPDSACFRGSPVFARVGIQFESHLGHA
jgi:hypothetical protein